VLAIKTATNVNATPVANFSVLLRIIVINFLWPPALSVQTLRPATGLLVAFALLDEAEHGCNQVKRQRLKKCKK